MPACRKKAEGGAKDSDPKHTNPQQVTLREIDEYYLRKVGVPHDVYWTNTLRENDDIAAAKLSQEEREWQRNRMIEFRIVQSAFVGGGMAKAQPLFKIKHPSELYKIGDEMEENKPRR